jgi:hypothetical protein
MWLLGELRRTSRDECRGTEPPIFTEKPVLEGLGCRSERSFPILDSLILLLG